MERENRDPLDLKAIRERLAEAKGPQYWKSLDELANTEEFQKFVEDEFPNRSTLLQLDRRQFLTLMGSSLALAGMGAGCRFLPEEKIVPYVKMPEELVPGKPLVYASTAVFGGYGQGVLVTSREGRPIKIEGNPDHPATLGSSDVFMQASILTMYDPDRSQNVMYRGEISTWDTFLKAARTAIASQRAAQGAGIRLLTETITSPTLADQIQAFKRAFPQARWHQYEAVDRDNVHAGAQLAFGDDVNAVYHFDKADVILSLDSDFLMRMPGSVRYARDFSSRRRVTDASGEMSRLYAVESAPTITGAAADNRIPLKASEVEGFARGLAQALGVEGGAGGAAVPAALVQDLQSHTGRCVVVPGEHQPPIVHALCHAINEKLGAAGSTVVYTEPVEAGVRGAAGTLKELTDDIAAGRVQMLVILGGNPVYSAPADLNLGQALAKVPFKAHLNLYDDETSAACDWHLPETHFLENWSDARAFDGTLSIVQPLIQPLYDGRSAHELLAALIDRPRPGYEIVREYWARTMPSSDFEKTWRRVLHDGLAANSALPAKAVSVKAGFSSAAPSSAPSGQGIEVIFQPDPTVWDGRFANNNWLQELPKPLTKLVWDNAALISANTAQRLGLSRNEVVELRNGALHVTAPVWIMPGHPDDAVTLNLGYGRTRAGQNGEDKGFRAEALRTSANPWFVGGVEIRKTGNTYDLTTTQHHFGMEGRDIIRVASLEEYKVKKKAAFHEGEGGEEVNEDLQKGRGLEGKADQNQISMYSGKDHEYEGYKWGMSIDLTTCIGCNACTIACQAENNIPVVGKEQVARGRAMHWIRIDRYYKSDPENEKTHLKNPEAHFQPVPCMHCEQAPCEPVCPVAATTHSHEGLNQMVYNRCVGTRYCSNNCPYKVRRFNFLNYANHHETPVLKLLNNPDVTVRGRGVMEKCTYCVQRINVARIEAKKADREIRDGEVVTACQQACPTQTIVFGNIADPNSLVSKRKAQEPDYPLLGELNTRPRTTYLAKLQNANDQFKTE